MMREFMIERQGRRFVLYAGLLDEAHNQGLKSIRTQLIQAPTADNGHLAICWAEVVTSKGTFSGLGDASPENVSRMMAPHLVRMAETRAKARALRDSINVGVVALEELGEFDEQSDGAEGHPRGARPSAEAPRGSEAERSPAASEEHARPGLDEHPRPAAASARPVTALPVRTGGPRPAEQAGPVIASPAQVRAIISIGRDQHGMTEQAIMDRCVAQYGVPLAELTRRQASEFIDSLKGAKGAAQSDAQARPGPGA